jgi:hypothetical protein
VRYRFRELARFVVSEARALEIAFPGDGAEPLTVRAERSAGSWQAEPVDVAPGKISDMLSELARLKGSEIVAEHAEQADLEALGLAPPRVVLRVFGTEGAAAESGGEGEDVEEATEADEEMEAEGGEAGTEPATRLLAEVQLGKADPERGIAARSPQHDAVYRIDSELAEQLPIDREAFESRFVVEEVEEEHEGLEEPEAGEGASPDGGSEAEMPLEEEAR